MFCFFITMPYDDNTKDLTSVLILYNHILFIPIGELIILNDLPKVIFRYFDIEFSNMMLCMKAICKHQNRIGDCPL